MIVVQVDGNIGSGKSTFMNSIKDIINDNNNNNSSKLVSIDNNNNNHNIEYYYYYYNNNSNNNNNNTITNNDNNINVKKIKIALINEPISDWTNNNNLFHLYYDNQKEYAELFQLNAFLTILNNCLKKIKDQDTDIVFMERSLFTCVYCFNQLLLNYGLIRNVFYEVLVNNYNLLKDKILQPDMIIYFKADNKDISLLAERIQKRQRKGEVNISLDYLSKLNSIYNKLMDEEKEYKDIEKYDIPVNIPLNEQQTLFNPIIHKILDIACI